MDHNGRVGSEAVIRLLAAFDRLSQPMLIADDDRRWVAGNAPAADLLGIARKEIPSHAVDEFTPRDERAGVPQQWAAFLRTGAAEGSYELYVAGRGLVTVDFSATANVLPARHLWILVARDDVTTGQAQCASPDAVAVSAEQQLTKREREIMTLVAAGGHSTDIAALLFVSPTTVKSHVSNAMTKLGAHTRAHAVALALLTGQITGER